MDTFPELDYGLLRLEKYINRIYEEWSTSPVRTLMIYGSIGCPYRCRFCINSVIHNSRYAHKSADRLLDEIESLINRYGITHVNFRDEDFFVSKEKLEKLLKGIGARGLRFTWDANARASYFNPGYLSREMLKRLKKSGCVRLDIGAESGSNRVLKMINKDITINQVMDSARTNSSAGIVIGYSFMIALPGETNDEMVQTAKFMIKLSQEDSRNYIIGPQVYRPYPGSELYQECLKHGLKQPQDLRSWDNEYLRSDVILGNRSKGLPWVKDIKFLKLLHFYSRCSVLFLKKGNFFEKIARRLISWISALRIKHGFLAVPIEYYSYRLLSRLT